MPSVERERRRLPCLGAPGSTDHVMVGEVHQREVRSTDVSRRPEERSPGRGGDDAEGGPRAGDTVVAAPLAGPDVVRVEVPQLVGHEQAIVALEADPVHAKPPLVSWLQGRARVAMLLDEMPVVPRLRANNDQIATGGNDEEADARDDADACGGGDGPRQTRTPPPRRRTRRRPLRARLLRAPVHGAPAVLAKAVEVVNRPASRADPGVVAEHDEPVAVRATPLRGPIAKRDVHGHRLDPLGSFREGRMSREARSMIPLLPSTHRCKARALGPSSQVSSGSPSSPPGPGHRTPERLVERIRHDRDLPCGRAEGLCPPRRGNGNPYSRKIIRSTLPLAKS